VDENSPVMLPFMAIFAAYGLYTLIGYLPKEHIKKVYIISALVIFSIPASTIIIDNYSFNNTNTKLVAQEWIEDNIPEGSKIAVEVYCPELKMQKEQIEAMLSGPECKNRACTEIKYDLNSEGLTRYWLEDVEWEKIVSNPLTYYSEKNVDYICYTHDFRKIYYDEPDKYGLQISRYEELDDSCQTVFEISPDNQPGPGITLCRLSI